MMALDKLGSVPSDEIKLNKDHKDQCHKDAEETCEVYIEDGKVYIEDVEVGVLEKILKRGFHPIGCMRIGKQVYEFELNLSDLYTHLCQKAVFMYNQDTEQAKLSSVDSEEKSVGDVISVDLSKASEEPSVSERYKVVVSRVLNEKYPEASLYRYSVTKPDGVKETLVYETKMDDAESLEYSSYTREFPNEKSLKEFLNMRGKVLDIDSPVIEEGTRVKDSNGKEYILEFIEEPRVAVLYDEVKAKFIVFPVSKFFELYVVVQ